MKMGETKSHSYNFLVTMFLDPALVCNESVLARKVSRLLGFQKIRLKNWNSFI